MSLSKDPRAQEFRRQLEALRSGLSDAPELLEALDQETAQQALSYLLELACRAQHIGNIELARRYLLAAPRAWLVAHIEPVAEGLIALEEGWEYRRLLELYDLLDGGLRKKLVSRGLLSENDEVREAAADFSEKG